MIRFSAGRRSRPRRPDRYRDRASTRVTNRPPCPRRRRRRPRWSNCPCSRPRSRRCPRNRRLHRLLRLHLHHSRGPRQTSGRRGPRRPRPRIKIIIKIPRPLVLRQPSPPRPPAALMHRRAAVLTIVGPPRGGPHPRRLRHPRLLDRLRCRILMCRQPVRPRSATTACHDRSTIRWDKASQGKSRSSAPYSRAAATMPPTGLSTSWICRKSRRCATSPLSLGERVRVRASVNQCGDCRLHPRPLSGHRQKVGRERGELGQP